MLTLERVTAARNSVLAQRSLASAAVRQRIEALFVAAHVTEFFDENDELFLEHIEHGAPQCSLSTNSMTSSVRQ